MKLETLGGATALVTGGAGFIGSHLVDALLAAGARVRVLDNLSTGSRRNLGGVTPRIELIEDDIRDLEACRRACAGATVVFHQAALGSVPRSMADPATTLAVNVGGTANVFAAAHAESVARVVYASSSSVYGDSAQLPKREGEEGAPLSPYALSKVMDEELAAHFARVFGLDAVGLRYFNVYGPRQNPQGPYAAVIPRFFAAAAAGEAAVIYGDGEQARDFTFVADAVAANLAAATAPAAVAGKAFNVAAGHAVSVNELAARVRELGGGGPAPEHRAARPGDVRCSLADLDLVRRTLAWQPRVALEEGLARTAEWFAAPGPTAG